MTSGFIFDLDGTIVDSERLGQESWDLAVTYFGLNLPTNFRDSLISIDFNQVIVKMERALPKSLSFATFQKKERSIFNQLISENGLPLKKGSVELMTAIRENSFPIALATSSSKETIAYYDQFFPLSKYFDVIVSGDMVSFGKPNPEIYLAAARGIDQRTETCYIVEDSLSGIEGAHRAHGIVVGIPDIIAFNKIIQAKCDYQFKDLEEFHSFLIKDQIISS